MNKMVEIRICLFQNTEFNKFIHLKANVKVLASPKNISHNLANPLFYDRRISSVTFRRFHAMIEAPSDSRFAFLGRQFNTCQALFYGLQISLPGRFLCREKRSKPGCGSLSNSRSNWTFISSSHYFHRYLPCHPGRNVLWSKSYGFGKIYG